MAESSFQSVVVKWLRSQGCYVIVTDGRPVGCPDVVALAKTGKWATIECKKDAKAKFRPLQELTIKKLSEMGYSCVAYPANWSQIQDELIQII